MEDFNTPLSSMERLFRQKINKKMMDLKNRTDQMDLTVFPFNSSRIHILFKYTQNIPEDISYNAAQNKSANLRKLKSYQISFQNTIYETRNKQEEEG